MLRQYAQVVTPEMHGVQERWFESCALRGVRISWRKSRERCNPMNREEFLVSAAGFEPATHALKGAPNLISTTTCTSSLLHARHYKINEMQTRHLPGCLDGAQNPASSFDCQVSFGKSDSHSSMPVIHLAW
jgi:hypothetical protein